MQQIVPKTTVDEFWHHSLMNWTLSVCYQARRDSLQNTFKSLGLFVMPWVSWKAR